MFGPDWNLGTSVNNLLAVQHNLATTYYMLGRLEEATRMRRDLYFGFSKLDGKEHERTLIAANNYASSLIHLECFEEAKSLMCKTMPVARRVLGDSHDTTLRTRWIYGQVLYRDPAATLDDLREAVTTFEDVERIAQRVVGGAHPLTKLFESHLRRARAALRGREDAEPDVSAQELDAAEAAAAAAVAAAAIKKRQRRETIERERSRRRTG